MFDRKLCRESLRRPARASEYMHRFCVRYNWKCRAIAPGLAFMSFLDNLESNLNNLERSAENDVADERARRQTERERALAVGPYAEELKKSPFTMALLNHATRIGFNQRAKVNIAWIGNTLRLEAKARRLELRPTPDGVRAVFSEDGAEVNSLPVDLTSDPESLASLWLNESRS